MIPLLTAEEMRSLDRHTVEVVGVPGPVLMETAGRGGFTHLWAAYEHLARRGPVAVVCGRGNNGGDGFVVARCLANRGCPVRVLLLGRREAVAGDAAVHLGALLGCGVEVAEVDDAFPLDETMAGASLVVDAVLGTGLEAPVRGLAARAIEAVNRAPAPVVSLDLPSGVSADTGQVLGVAVAADLTVTFAWPKRGHYLHPGASLRGRLEVVEIGIPTQALALAGPGLW
ncbi:MAG: NAD(P)H-hydrate epimerase, partial [Deferrisomatales bacterium]